MAVTGSFGPTILIVEDDYNIREAFKEVLESSGYTVLTATNGLDGLIQLRNNPKPSLVLLDLMMPIMSGREFLNAVLADGTLSLIPIVVASAIANPVNTAGATAYVTKPVHLDQLLDTVSHFVDAA